MKTYANEFAIVFFAGHPLSDEQVLQMGQETKAWAKALNATGRSLRPHMFEPDRVLIGHENSGTKSPSAVLFLSASDMADAVDVAKAHPALRYGYSAEVRAWKAPAPSVAGQPAPGTQ